MSQRDSITFSTLYGELVSILEDLQNIDFTGCNNSTETSRLNGYFCLEAVFNLSKKILTEAEVKVIEKGLEYAPIQTFKIVHSKLDYFDFSKEEWQAMRAVADDMSNVIKKLTKDQLLWFGP